MLSVERQHGAGDFGGLHRLESVVDVAEETAFGHHAVEVEPAPAVEIERDVVSEAVRAMCDVCTLHSGRIDIHENSIVTSSGSAPMIGAVLRIARFWLGERA